MKEYLEKKEDVLSQVESNENGLTSAQASSRLEKNGKNKLAEGKKDCVFLRARSFQRIFLLQRLMLLQ